MANICPIRHLIFLVLAVVVAVVLVIPLVDAAFGIELFFLNRKGAMKPTCTKKIYEDHEENEEIPTNVLTCKMALNCIGTEREKEVSEEWTNGHDTFCEWIDGIMYGEYQPGCRSLSKKIKNFCDLHTEIKNILFGSKNLIGYKDAHKYFSGLHSLIHDGPKSLINDMWQPLWKKLGGNEAPDKNLAKYALKIKRGDYKELPCLGKLQSDVKNANPPSQFTINVNDLVEQIGNDCFMEGEHITQYMEDKRFCNLLTATGVWQYLGRCPRGMDNKQALTEWIIKLIICRLDSCRDPELDTFRIGLFLGLFKKLQIDPEYYLHKFRQSYGKCDELHEG